MELRSILFETLEFKNLEEVKHYFYDDVEPCEEEYLGDDFAGYCESWREYNRQIMKAETYKELVDVLNKHADTFGNGSEFYIAEE